MAVLNSTVGLIYSIKADDSEARKSVSDLRRHIDNETSQIEQDGSNAFLSLGKNIGLTDEQLAGLGKTLPIVGAVAGVFATGVVAVTTAVVSATAALFKLSNEAAEFGSEIFDASEKTGLSAETLSSLKLAADQSGSSLEQVTTSIAKFSRLVGEAAQGSEEAKNKLKAFGVDPQEAINDLDGALEKVFKRIVELPPGIQQAKAAQDAFGKSGTDLLPFIKSFDGDMKGLIKTAKELGVTIDDGAAAAADEFGDTLDQTKAQVKGIANTIGLEFMPIFLDATKNVSAWLKENRGDIKTWATNSADLIRGLIGYWTDLKTAVQGYAAAFNQSRFAQETGTTAGGLARRITDPFGVTDVGIALVQGGAKRGQNERKGSADSSLGGNLGTAQSDYLQDLEGQKRASKERLDTEKRNANATIEYWKNTLQNIRGEFTKTFEKIKEQFKQTGNKELLDLNMQDAIQFYVEKYNEADLKLQKLEQQQAKRNKATKAELQLLQQESYDRLGEWLDQYQNAQNEARKLGEEGVKKQVETEVKETAKKLTLSIELERAYTENYLKILQSRFQQGLVSEKLYIEESQNARQNLLNKEKQANEELLKNENLTAEQIADIKQKQTLLEISLSNQKLEFEKEWRDFYNKELENEIDKRGKVLEIEQRISEEKERQQRALDIAPRPGYDASGNETTTAPVNGSILSDIVGGLGNSVLLDSIDEAGNRVYNFSNAWKAVGDIASQALSSMAQGIGNMVQNLVLLGNTGGNSFRKLVASVLAGVASQAAVLAVMETAYGIAALTPWGAAIYGNPAFHFKAAALFGSIAVATGLLGRAVAGDAFKQQASGSTVGGTSNSSSQGNSNGGTQYSSYGNDIRTITNDRNQPQGRIKIELDPGLIAKVIREDVGNNGQIRRTLIDVVQGA